MKGTSEYRIFRNLDPTALIGEINALPNLFMASLHEEDDCLRILVCDAAYWNAIDGSPSDEEGVHPKYSVIYEIVFKKYDSYSCRKCKPQVGVQRYRVFNDSPYLNYLSAFKKTEKITHYSFQFEHQIVDVASTSAPQIVKYQHNERFDKDAEDLI